MTLAQIAVKDTSVVALRNDHEALKELETEFLEGIMDMATCSKPDQATLGCSARSTFGDQLEGPQLMQRRRPVLTAGPT